MHASEAPASWVRADERVARPRWRVGDRFGGLRIDSLLAVGATRAVYAVTDPSGSRGALKLPIGAPNDAVRAVFEREARITALAASAGAPKILASGTASDGTPYILSELMTGLTLEQRRYRRGGRFDPLTALFIVERIAAMLDRLHEMGIVHHDVGPANIFVTAHGDVRLFGFGRATTCSDPATDLRALGATLALMLTGSVDAVDAIGQLPPPLVALLETALGPDSRFPSAYAFRESIADAYRALTPLW